MTPRDRALAALFGSGPMEAGIAVGENDKYSISVPMLERAIASAERDKLRTLAEACRTFAPDLMAELTARFVRAGAAADQALEGMLAVLRRPV